MSKHRRGKPNADSKGGGRDGNRPGKQGNQSGTRGGPRPKNFGLGDPGENKGGKSRK